MQISISISNCCFQLLLFIVIVIVAVACSSSFSSATELFTCATSATRRTIQDTIINDDVLLRGLNGCHFEIRNVKAWSFTFSEASSSALITDSDTKVTIENVECTKNDRLCVSFRNEFRNAADVSITARGIRRSPSILNPRSLFHTNKPLSGLNRIEITDCEMTWSSPFDTRVPGDSKMIQLDENIINVKNVIVSNNVNRITSNSFSPDVFILYVGSPSGRGVRNCDELLMQNNSIVFDAEIPDFQQELFASVLTGNDPFFDKVKSLKLIQNRVLLNKPISNLQNYKMIFMHMARPGTTKETTFHLEENEIYANNFYTGPNSHQIVMLQSASVGVFESKVNIVMKNNLMHGKYRCDSSTSCFTYSSFLKLDAACPGIETIQMLGNRADVELHAGLALFAPFVNSVSTSDLNLFELRNEHYKVFAVDAPTVNILVMFLLGQTRNWKTVLLQNVTLDAVASEKSRANQLISLLYSSNKNDEIQNITMTRCNSSFVALGRSPVSNFGFLASTGFSGLCQISMTRNTFLLRAQPVGIASVAAFATNGNVTIDLNEITSTSTPFYFIENDIRVELLEGDYEKTLDLAKLPAAQAKIFSFGGSVYDPRYVDPYWNILLLPIIALRNNITVFSPPTLTIVNAMAFGMLFDKDSTGNIEISAHGNRVTNTVGIHHHTDFNTGDVVSAHLLVVRCLIRCPPGKPIHFGNEHSTFNFTDNHVSVSAVRVTHRPLVSLVYSGMNATYDTMSLILNTVTVRIAETARYQANVGLYMNEGWTTVHSKLYVSSNIVNIQKLSLIEGMNRCGSLLFLGSPVSFEYLRDSILEVLNETVICNLAPPNTTRGTVSFAGAYVMFFQKILGVKENQRISLTIAGNRLDAKVERDEQYLDYSSIPADETDDEDRTEVMVLQLGEYRADDPLTTTVLDVPQIAPRILFDIRENAINIPNAYVTLLFVALFGHYQTVNVYFSEIGFNNISFPPTSVDRVRTLTVNIWRCRPRILSCSIKCTTTANIINMERDLSARRPSDPSWSDPSSSENQWDHISVMFIGHDTEHVPPTTLGTLPLIDENLVTGSFSSLTSASISIGTFDNFSFALLETISSFNYRIRFQNNHIKLKELRSDHGEVQSSIFRHNRNLAFIFNQEKSIGSIQMLQLIRNVIEIDHVQASTDALISTWHFWIKTLEIKGGETRVTDNVISIKQASVVKQDIIIAHIFLALKIDDRNQLREPLNHNSVQSNVIRFGNLSAVNRNVLVHVIHVSRQFESFASPSSSSHPSSPPCFPDKSGLYTAELMRYNRIETIQHHHEQSQSSSSSSVTSFTSPTSITAQSVSIMMIYVRFSTYVVHTAKLWTNNILLHAPLLINAVTFAKIQVAHFDEVLATTSIVDSEIRLNNSAPVVNWITPTASTATQHQQGSNHNKTNNHHNPSLEVGILETNINTSYVNTFERELVSYQNQIHIDDDSINSNNNNSNNNNGSTQTTNSQTNIHVFLIKINETTNVTTSGNSYNQTLVISNDDVQQRFSNVQILENTIRHNRTLSSSSPLLSLVELSVDVFAIQLRTNFQSLKMLVQFKNNKIFIASSSSLLSHSSSSAVKLDYIPLSQAQLLHENEYWDERRVKKNIETQQKNLPLYSPLSIFNFTENSFTATTTSSERSFQILSLQQQPAPFTNMSSVALARSFWQFSCNNWSSDAQKKFHRVSSPTLFDLGRIGYYDSPGVCPDAVGQMLSWSKSVSVSPSALSETRSQTSASNEFPVATESLSRSANTPSTSFSLSKEQSLNTTSISQDTDTATVSGRTRSPTIPIPVDPVSYAQRAPAMEATTSSITALSVATLDPVSVAFINKMQIMASACGEKDPYLPPLTWESNPTQFQLGSDSDDSAPYRGAMLMNAVLIIGLLVLGCGLIWLYFQFLKSNNKSDKMKKKKDKKKRRKLQDVFANDENGDDNGIMMTEAKNNSNTPPSISSAAIAPPQVVVGALKENKTATGDPHEQSFIEQFDKSKKKDEGAALATTPSTFFATAASVGFPGTLYIVLRALLSPTIFCIGVVIALFFYSNPTPEETAPKTIFDTVEVVRKSYAPPDALQLIFLIISCAVFIALPLIGLSLIAYRFTKDEVLLDRHLFFLAAKKSTCGETLVFPLANLLVPKQIWDQDSLQVRSFNHVFKGVSVAFFVVFDILTDIIIAMSNGIAAMTPSRSSCEAVRIVTLCVCVIHFCVLMRVRPSLSNFQRWMSPVMSLTSLCMAVLALWSYYAPDALGGATSNFLIFAVVIAAISSVESVVKFIVVKYIMKVTIPRLIKEEKMNLEMQAKKKTKMEQKQRERETKQQLKQEQKALEEKKKKKHKDHVEKKIKRKEDWKQQMEHERKRFEMNPREVLDIDEDDDDYDELTLQQRQELGEMDPDLFVSPHSSSRKTNNNDNRYYQTAQQQQQQQQDLRQAQTVSLFEEPLLMRSTPDDENGNNDDDLAGVSLESPGKIARREKIKKDIDRYFAQPPSASKAKNHKSGIKSSTLDKKRTGNSSAASSEFEFTLTEEQMNQLLLEEDEDEEEELDRKNNDSLL